VIYRNKTKAATFILPMFTELSVTVWMFAFDKNITLMPVKIEYP